MNAWLRLLISITLTGASATAVGAESEPAPAKAPPSAEEQARSYFTDLPVVTQDGEVVRFYSDVLKDRVVLVSFIFTHCQDACPLMTQKLLKVRELIEDQMGNPIYFVTISIDPERDTPEAMKRFAEKQSADGNGWLFLTGKTENLNHIVKKLGQYTDDIEAHSTLILAGNVKTRHWMKILPMVPPVGIAEKLRSLAAEG